MTDPSSNGHVKQEPSDLQWLLMAIQYLEAVRVNPKMTEAVRRAARRLMDLPVLDQR